MGVIRHSNKEIRAYFVGFRDVSSIKLANYNFGALEITDAVIFDFDYIVAVIDGSQAALLDIK